MLSIIQVDKSGNKSYNQVNWTYGFEWRRFTSYPGRIIRPTDLLLVIGYWPMIGEAIIVVKDFLNKDDTLKERTKLSLEQFVPC